MAGKIRYADMAGKKETAGKKEKDGPGPVVVSDTLCPAVHILGT